MMYGVCILSNILEIFLKFVMLIVILERKVFIYFIICTQERLWLLPAHQSLHPQYPLHHPPTPAQEI